jgi:hypothetical protein
MPSRSLCPNKRRQAASRGTRAWRHWSESANAISCTLDSSERGSRRSCWIQWCVSISVPEFTRIPGASRELTATSCNRVATPARAVVQPVNHNPSVEDTPNNVRYIYTCQIHPLRTFQSRVPARFAAAHAAIRYTPDCRVSTTAEPPRHPNVGGGQSCLGIEGTKVGGGLAQLRIQHTPDEAGGAPDSMGIKDVCPSLRLPLRFTVDKAPL